MPIYEFQCAQCKVRFEDLVPAGTERSVCPACGEGNARRVFSSAISPPGRLPRGAKVRESDARRGEREAARRDRLAETQKLRARGEVPPPRPGKRQG